MRRHPEPTPTDSQPPANPAIPDRLAYRLDELAEALGVSRRTIERERSAGRFPKPDRTIGKMPVWSPSTIRDWLERGDPR